MDRTKSSLFITPLVMWQCFIYSTNYSKDQKYLLFTSLFSLSHSHYLTPLLFKSLFFNLHFLMYVLHSLLENRLSISFFMDIQHQFWTDVKIIVIKSIIFNIDYQKPMLKSNIQHWFSLKPMWYSRK